VQQVHLPLQMELAYMHQISGRAFFILLIHVARCVALDCELAGLCQLSRYLALVDSGLYGCRPVLRPSFQDAIQAWQAKHDDAALPPVADRLVEEHHQQSAAAEQALRRKEVSICF